MKVSQLMCPAVITCRPEDSLDSAACKLWNHDIGCLPVVDDDHRPVGMLTDRDICMAAYTQGRLLKDIRVDSVMSKVVFSAPPTDRIEDVEVVMRVRKVHRVPIVDDENRIIGVVSTNDLAREAALELRRKHPDVSEDEFVSTLACICEPRHRASPFPAAAE
ncbi:MAG TPA: CBS domain-containing protein [Polyangiaceae bacterium]|nr:CBS domain-containing protein [Polyangiaceae bacterium]